MIRSKSRSPEAPVFLRTVRIWLRTVSSDTRRVNAANHQSVDQLLKKDVYIRFETSGRCALTE